MKLLDSKRGTALRAFLRAALVCATAFGLKLDASQVAALQLIAEAALRLLVEFTPDKP